VHHFDFLESRRNRPATSPPLHADANAEPLAVIQKFNTGLFQHREYRGTDDRDWRPVTSLKRFNVASAIPAAVAKSR
jgi:hypothetical protein